MFPKILEPSAKKTTSQFKLLGSLAVLVVWCAGNSVIAQTTTGRSPGDYGAARARYAKLPLGFNRQDAASGEAYVARGQGYEIGLQNGRATIAISGPDGDGHRQVVSLDFEGRKFEGEKAAGAVPAGELPGKVNLIHGNDPARWLLGLASYGTVKYRNVYDGVDLVYYGNQQQLEFDLIVNPGANPGAIRLKFGGVGKLSLDDSGGLRLGSDFGALRMALPEIYQNVSGRKKRIPGHYSITGPDTVAFRIDPWDKSQPLIIDPTFVYSALFGGGLNSNGGYGIQVDSSNNIFLTGYTYAADFPTLNATQNQVNGGADVFVTKLNSAWHGDDLLNLPWWIGLRFRLRTGDGRNRFSMGYGVHAVERLPCPECRPDLLWRWLRRVCDQTG